MKETGFSAMGLCVPSERLQKGYEMIKGFGFDKESSMSMARRIARFIKADKTAYIIGDVCLATILQRALFEEQEQTLVDKPPVDEQLASIDLTGRYKVLATMLTD